MPVTIAIAAGAVALLAAPQAVAGSVGELISDCPDGIVDGDYTRGQLQRGLNEIPADNAEYGYCHDAITAALATAGPGDGKARSASTGGPDGPSADLDGDGVVTPAERREAKRRDARERASARARERERDGEKVDSAGAGPALQADDSSSGPSLPAVLALAVLAFGVLGGGLWLAARRNPAVANALGRIRPPRG